MTTAVTIYQQEMFGQEHWRAVRNDGVLLFRRHQTDFPSESEAIAAVEGDFRRRRESVIIRVQYLHADKPKTVSICSN